MRSVIVDLTGDVAWSGAAERYGATYVAVRPELCEAADRCEVLVVDGRGIFKRGLELMASVAPRTRASVRVFVTEREPPLDHKEAYLAGATRVVVMALGETGHVELLRELADEGH